MDTTTGHWEMVGIITERGFPTFPDGFPAALLEEFSRRTGRGVLGNVAASGTEIIQQLGEQHQRSGDWIVYTSADSVFQLAAHEQTVPVEELYAGCRVARELLTGGLAVGRVIARPFEGTPGAYVRTPRRHDFSLLPPRPNQLQRLRERGRDRCTPSARSATSSPARTSTRSAPTESNAQGIARTIARLRSADDRSLVFTNLVETDMVWGHRNDPEGFADALREFDEELPRLMAALRHGDLLLLTSDHGCDPDHAFDRPLARARACCWHTWWARPRSAAVTTATPSPTSAPPSAAT